MNTKETKRGTAKRLSALALALVMLFMLLPVQVGAADGNNVVTVSPNLFRTITLSQEYTTVESTSKLVTLQDGSRNATEYVIKLPQAADTVNFTCEFDTLNNMTYTFYAAEESAAEESAAEGGTVTLNVKKTHTDVRRIPELGSEVISTDFPETGELSVDDSTPPTSSLSVQMENGVGETKYLALYTGEITAVDSTSTPPLLTRTYYLSGIYKFKFVVEAPQVDPTPTITSDLTFNGHLCGLNGTLEPLRVEATAAEGVELSYQWYRGSSQNDVTTAIENATDASYMPPTDTLGTTYYKVIVTGTVDGRSETAESTVARVVVRESSTERQFSLTSALNQPVSKLDGSDHIYYVRFQTAELMDQSPLIMGSVVLQGVLPDGVTIDEVWAGSPGDVFDDFTLTVDDVTGAFRLFASSYTAEEALASSMTHNFGKCYYFRLSSGDVYTVIIDNDWKQHLGDEAKRRPQVVELVDEGGDEALILEDFLVSNFQSDNNTSSVVRGTLTSDHPVVLRAEVQSGGFDLSTTRVQKNRAPYYWDKAQRSWVVVNGQRMPESGFFSGNASNEQSFTSPAFTLQPGLNVVEVYTDAFSFYLDPRLNSKTTGLGTYYYDRQEKRSTTPLYNTTSVVYLIDYQGESAETLPSEADNAELELPAALRFGEVDSQLEACPLMWDEAAQSYTLAVPDRYRTGADDSSDSMYSIYGHAVLLSMRTAAAGASAEIIDAPDGMIVGEQVGSCVFLNMLTLKGQENPGFTIRVTAADGETTKDYPVKVVYASSTTTPELVIGGGATLDGTFDADTYSYYVDYTGASAENGTLTATLPAGSTATIDGQPYTSGATWTLDPTKDFYRLTITAEDHYTVTSYYFVTRYKDGTIPYATVSDSTKALAKEMLGRWYQILNSSEYLSSYWGVFEAAATGKDENLTPFDFNGIYVEDPARHQMKQATDWAACIMEIVILGYNPYHFPYYDEGVYKEDFNYVDALIKCGGGAWANNVWYHMASQAAGAPRVMRSSMHSNALERTHDLDTRGWVIASLSGGEPTREMVRFIDSLHDVQNTKGEYVSLWTNQGWHSAATGGENEDGSNVYTIGCVLSAIAAGGGDVEKLYAVGDNTPLQTIYDKLYEDGLFDGAMPKDMIIGLGDILHGSNVWARYALTEEKYNDLIAKARTEGFTTEAGAMPPYAQTVDVGEAYYNLYDQVAKKLVARNDYSMRANVTFGMPHELFADEVKKMPAADDLKEENLDALTKLIQQYEALDESSRESLEKDNATQGTTKTYQKLVKAGLALKEKNTESAKKVEDIYDGINALPDTVTASNAEAAKKAAADLREKIKNLTEKERELLDWTGGSVLEKLKKVENATPVAEITVSFTLYGDTLHKVTDDTDLHSYQFTPTEDLVEWVPTTSFTVPANSTVHDVFDAAVKQYGLKYVENRDRNYVSSITSADGVTLKEKDNTTNSGWMYTLNGQHPNLGLAEQTVKNNDVIVWHWTDDYTIEQGSEHWSNSRVVEYIANLLDANADNANYAYGKLDFDLKANVNTFRNNRNTLRTVEEAIQAINWRIPLADNANDYNAVYSWVNKKLNDVKGQLDGGELALVMDDPYNDVIPAIPGLDGSFTAKVILTKGDGDSRVTLEVAINGTIEHPISSSAAVKSVTVCGTAASANGNSYTVTVPYGSSVTAASFTIVPDDGASVTGPTEEDGVWKFTVTAEDGTTTEEYTVKVSVASKPAGGGTSGKPAKSNKDQQTAEPDDGLTFTDVRTGSWYYEAVQYAAENGLMTGTSATQFAPNADTTRGMIVTILARLEGEDTSGTPWYAAGRRWAMDAGVSDGTNMDGRITREQLAAMLYRYAKAKGCDVSASADISAYTDASGVSAWALDAMRWAVGAGLIGGRTATTLAPQGNATRAEVAAILMRFAQKIAN